MNDELNEWLQSVASTGNQSGDAANGAAQPARNAANAESKGEAAAPQDEAAAAAQQARAAATRARIHEALGQVVLTMASVARYRHMALSDLQGLVMEPLLRDKIAMARARPEESPQATPEPAGIAFWASVSDEVDAKIREQIAANVFPIRLKPQDWVSGNKIWLLDVLAPNSQIVTAVLGNFQKAMKTPGEIHVHPVVARQVDPDVLKKMGRTAPPPEAPAG
jgi:cytolysin-activating lysine-acyltransferase